eukprot:CAMPEP_0201489328 /NCGR_PEP_ID=MMETSP0151_2-20130828/22112_1 /ASSEMBLY_ACC=CAM_ASM_000257 /TAXON_ID=200890 /ORGANISM="Paramoeba atlantica, Strain 621/1 / CCAP 1560/9" /LENGTH=333 /DNA_ID=CAMNT_0047874883 /DNA_START=17 /DNA_END=1018 /DNA_ORIENTATION=+
MATLVADNKPPAPHVDCSDESTIMKDNKKSGVMLPNGNWVLGYFFHQEATIKKLVTREDNFHIHKTLGILSVLSFFYRYAFVYPTTGTLGFDIGYNKFNWLSMIVHMTLSFSSIIFRVPAHRISKKPMIIYEEYRQHAIVFTLRCFLVFIIGTVFPEAPVYTIPLVLTACHLFVDDITRRHGTAGNTAVRTNTERMATSTFYKMVGLLYSFYQFLALGAMILPTDCRADMGFNAIIAIQSSAFMMTLYRKKIVRGRTHMLVYSLCLLVSAFHFVRVIGLVSTALIAATFALRISLPRQYSNKYVLWTAFFLTILWRRDLAGVEPIAALNQTTL